MCLGVHVLERIEHTERTDRTGLDIHSKKSYLMFNVKKRFFFESHPESRVASFFIIPLKIIYETIYNNALIDIFLFSINIFYR